MVLRIFLSLLIFLMIVPDSCAKKSHYADEIVQLKNINNNLHKQLLSATDEIKKLKVENQELKTLGELQGEIEKIKRELVNKSSEVKMLREQVMMSKDYSLNGQ